MKSKKLLLEENLTSIDSKKKNYNLKEFLKQVDPNKNKFKKIEGIFHGLYPSKKAGSGLDFNEIREYQIGDDLRHISWATTAKTGLLHSKEYFSDNEICSFFLIDISNSMYCGKKLNAFVNLVALSLNAASLFSEKVGCILFSGEIELFLPLGNSRNQANITFNAIINHIHNLKKASKTTYSKTNLYQALEISKRQISKKGLFFIISDFINLSSNWEKLLFEITNKQNIYLFQLYDEIDFKLPKVGYITIIDPETKEKITVNTDSQRFRVNYKNFMSKKDEKLKIFFRSIGAKYIQIESDNLI